MPESRIKIWILASRPKTLWAAVAPVMIGTALAIADGKVHWLAAFCALFGAVMIQIGTNFSNDYFDFVQGADTHERLGPTRATQAGLISFSEIKRAAVAAFGLAVLAGVYLLWRGGWPILVIGSLSILAGILYTAGPYPLGYNGLGDIFVFVFFGLIAVGGTYYVQALSIDAVVLLAGIGPGLLSTALLCVNNLRDIENDRKAGKRTLPVRFGRRFGQWEYAGSLLLAALVPVFLVIQTQSHFWVILASASILPAVRDVQIIFKENPGPIYNRVLGNTGKLIFIYSALFSLGWIL
ncbi:MAG TPA: 1,4-dihydroxy-2-naphthoate polyprenyltransferase [Bacteroidetes bacterium]|nr:1,4-dihydroxy-2-naphthoate polyprenyltransferase [Bacteroidota bacterium]